MGEGGKGIFGGVHLPTSRTLAVNVEVSVVDVYKRPCWAGKAKAKAKAKAMVSEMARAFACTVGTSWILGGCV